MELGLVIFLSIFWTSNQSMKGFKDSTLVLLVMKCHHHEQFTKILSLPLVLQTTLFQSLPQIHEHK